LTVLLAAIATLGLAPGIAQAAFPGTNGKLAFGSARNGHPSDNDLWTMSADGTSQTRITSLDHHELNPAWSASGSKIAFERNTGLNSDIWVANSNGTNAAQVTTNAANDLRPAWNPTGTKIVFSSDRGTPNVFDLFVMDPNGANQVNITNTPTISEEYPSWSPDGTALAFARDGDIYKSSPNGTILKRLTSGTFQEYEPDWSPTNDKIVYRTGIDTPDNIWTVTSNGTGHVNVTNNGSIVEEHPTWSPDGTKIAFIRGAFKDAEVYTMNPDGTAQTRITTNTVMDTSTAWQATPIPGRYVRPAGAASLLLPLVPSFRPCRAPNRMHGTPLNHPSCKPPRLYSRYLTIGTQEVNGKTSRVTGNIKITAIAGDPNTTSVDEADVKMRIKIADVRKASDLSDYTGQLRVKAEYRRQTDKENAVGAAPPVESGTSTDSTWGVGVQCVSTADVNVGSNCNLTTTRDTLVPGSIKEGKRAILQLGRFQVWDGGADGLNSTKVNDLFLTQGIFVP
jgi:Tol biopolymer transport system component